MHRKMIRYATLLAICTVFPTLASAQVQRQRGATVGGLVGAVAGALIGDHNGEAGAGAAIGGAVGAVTGGLLGDAADKEAAAYQQQQIYRQQQFHGVQRQSAVSVHDVINMSRSGLGEQVIINQIQTRGVPQTLQVSDIILLHQQGVSEHVITAMQNAAQSGPRIAQAPAAPQTVVTPAPVIVEEHYVVPHYAPPRYYYRPPVRHHHHHHGIRVQF